MPLFMFISGYLASVTSTEEALSWSKIGRTILKKSRTLLLPSLTWGIAIPYLLLEKAETSLPRVINDWLQIWGGGLWFLNTLFVLSLLFLLYKAVVQRLRNQSLWVHLLVLGGGFIVLLLVFHYAPQGIYSEGLKSVTAYFLFYFGGVLVGKHKQLEKLLFDVRFFSIFLLLFCLLLPSFVYDMSSLKNQLMKMVLGSCAIPCMFYIVVHLTWNKYLDSIFQYWGRESLAIYTMHNGPFAFVLGLSGTLPLLSVVDLYSTFWFVLISFIVCFLSIWIKTILSLSPVLNLLLYGKKWRKTSQFINNIQ